MGAPSQVKTRILAGALALLLSASARAAEPLPEAQEILRAVRLTQSVQHETLHGQLRNGAQKTPFTLLINGPAIRYEFAGPPPLAIVLRLAEKEARLSEVTKEGTERVSGHHWSEPVQGTDISYEDLSLRFLYWPNAQVLGEERMLLQPCWKLTVPAPAASDSQYGHVALWVEKDSGALMQAEAFDKTGKFARRFKVISGQKIDGGWYLKQMRIEAPAGGRKDPTPTYLEIQSVERGQ